MKKVVKKVTALCMLLACVCLLTGIGTAFAANSGGSSGGDRTVYVSSSGDDSGSGKEAAPFKSFAKAYESGADKIVLMSDITADLSAYADLPIIEGYSGAEKLTNSSSSLSLSGALTVDRLVLSGVKEIIANGYELTIGENTSTSGNITVYGGKSGENLTGDTNVILLGGFYGNIYGGGKNGSVIGNTNVFVGGNVNPGQEIDDRNGVFTGTRIYGGGKNGEVSGTANATMSGNAVARYLIGAGEGTNAYCYNTNIRIEGGKIMNVYAGAASDGPELKNCNTKITMAGGGVEALFGGSEGKPLTGNTVIELIGGTVYRRVYSGCYNNADTKYTSIFGVSVPTGLSWSSNHSVTGTTAIMIYPTCSVNQSSYLKDGEDTDVGVYAGSRTKSAISTEYNTVIFEEDCYSSKEDVMGCHDLKGGVAGLSSHPDYTVKSGANGITKSAYETGKIYIEPNNGYVGKVSSVTYKNEKAPVSSSTTVTFSAYEGIYESACYAERTDDGVYVYADMGTDSYSDACTYVAVYETENGVKRLVGVETDNTLAKREFNIECELASDKEYTASIMIWKNSLAPLVEKCALAVE